ncbi:MAG: hypothetical protein NE328_09100 [Lentisphaeraceae bacterium]|nr:hypothetical protein [Lentisphaeraceae bacterium]
MSKDNYPKPREDLKSFSCGDEIIDLGRSQSSKDCHFEVLDPRKGVIRSLMTGDDIQKDNGHFLLIHDLENLPETINLENAKKGEFYKNIIDDKEYQVISADDEFMVKLLDLENNQVRIHSRMGSSFYLKFQPDGDAVPPIDEDGQYLLFDF